MATVRALETVVVHHFDPEILGMVSVREGDPYDAKDPLVKAYPWLFASDVERATAAPGEKRNVSTR